MKKPPETYDINESFPMLLTTCVKYMRESLNARFKQAGFNITTEQWNLLAHLQEQDGLSQQALADRYRRSKVSALNLIKKLEGAGLITRHPDPVDGRTNRVYLTPKGRKTIKDLIPLAVENIDFMRSGITDEEIQSLKSVIRKITQNLLI
jgi:DNA-binding MarR family transcriptional regulator